MKVEMLEHTRDYIRFVVKGARRSLVNALRRTIMADLPIFAPDEIIVYENSSPIWDEYIAHRIGLVPFRVEGEPTENQEIVLYLEKEGPGTVYSGDIKAQEPGISVVDDRIPLVKLDKGQAIRMEIILRVGTGSQHVKWQPGLVAFKPVAKLEGKNIPHEAEEHCPKKILEIHDGKPVLRDPYACSLCKECEKFGVKVNKHEDQFVVYVESFGQLDPEEMVRRAVKRLLKKLDELEGAI